MTATRIYRTGPDHFSGTRPSTDADRLQKHGPVQGMAEPCDWFTIPVRVTMIAGTLAVAAYAFFPAASLARPDAQQPDAFEARAGGKFSR